MLEPTIPGWKVETLGDDIAWMRIGDDGRLYAVNPEYGFFGVAPGTNEHTNPNAMRTIEPGQLGVHQRRAHRRRRHLVGGHGEHPGPRHRLEGRAVDARQRRAVQPPEQPLLHADQAVPDPRPGVRRPARRPDRRDPVRWPPQDHDPAGDRGPRLDARHVHGRHAVARRPPPPRSARSASSAATRWRCCRSSATTPATTSTTGSPSARSNDAAKLPQIFYVNWFRRDDDGGFLWPGFGENSRVLKWVIERIEGTGRRRRDPDRPRADAGVARHRRPRHDPPRSSAQALAVDPEEWKAEIPQIQEWFDKFGDKLPGRPVDRARRPQGAPGHVSRRARARRPQVITARAIAQKTVMGPHPMCDDADVGQGESVTGGRPRS